MHMPLIPLLGGGTHRDRPRSDKQERKSDRNHDCCRGHHAKCHACEAGTSVLEYCERQKWPTHIPGCREAVKDATTIPRNQTVLPASGPMPAVNPFEGANADSATVTDCCTENTAQCMSCNVGMTIKQYCALPDVVLAAGCSDAESLDTGEEQTGTPKVNFKVSPPSTTHAPSSTTLVGRQPTLFCFSLMLPWGYEPSLLKMQRRHKSSIFACEATAVYSSEEQDLGGIKTEDLGIDLHCKLGGVFNTVMNTPIFVEVWKRLIKDAVFRHYDWTVKVDPDAVFFPERLRHILGSQDQASAQAGNGTFLNNCGFGLHGPLEVLSRRALEVYGSGNSACDRPPQEDVYLQKCLLALGVTQVNRFNLLAEDHCHFKEWKACKSGHVSFHPFKKIKDYEKCLAAVDDSTDT